MVSYNNKDWTGFLFSFNKSDTLRRLLPLMAILGLYCWGVTWLFMNNNLFHSNVYLKNSTALHSLLGFAISILLVFRTNTAYDRWWEGRKLWGSLVNNSRNLSIKLNAFLPHNDHNNRQFFQQLIPRFALELMNHLQSEETRLILDEKPHPEIPNFDQNKHVPNQVASLIITRIQLMYQQKIINGEQLIVLNGEMSSFMDICGACERIKNTPIPFGYSGFIKKFLFIYILTLPIGYVYSLGYYVIPVVLFVFYVLASMELIAEEIEDPFGKDINDLPIKRITENIGRNVREILSW